MTIGERIENVRERIEKAASRAGRNPKEIRLMGVSKFHGQAEIEEAISAGLFLFGENRVQEALVKFPAIKAAPSSSVELHMIGSLQRNKAKQALLLFDGIQSLDRDELICALGNAAALNKNNPDGNSCRAYSRPAFKFIHGPFPLVACRRSRSPSWYDFG
ncbi:hypothetical protein AGMMS50230_22970 [Spirochaetia bacterium]|nr:hypothetical protein AGMMS50230_22970 [Spirochaetia bacterium]